MEFFFVYSCDKQLHLQVKIYLTDVAKNIHRRGNILMYCIKLQISLTYNVMGNVRDNVQ